MLALVAGNTLNNVNPFGFQRNDILQNARDDRYFAIVSAYDFAAAKEKKKKLLWQAKMSTPSNRVSLAEVIPGLIAAGGPHFGRETKLPESVTAPIAKEGIVEIGTPTVVDDSAKPAAPPRKSNASARLLPPPARPHPRAGKSRCPPAAVRRRRKFPSRPPGTISGQIPPAARGSASRPPLHNP